MQAAPLTACFANQTMLLFQSILTLDRGKNDSTKGSSVHPAGLIFLRTGDSVVF